MKKIDKLLIKSFLGPFLLTFVVVVFILLMQFMMKYFDDMIGKGLDMSVYGRLLFYFSINMTPVALPLAILLSSLMTFGNLGENFELTAIKSSGISLLRVIRPLFFLVLFISGIAFLSNNYVVPKSSLKAYRLLYDVKQKKPSLDIQEGVFYGGIPGYSIKVNKKYPDGETLKDLIIYDHTSGTGNKKVILADSGKMYTFNNNRYLMFDLYNGNSYFESQNPAGGRISRGSRGPEEFTRNSFKESKMVFSLEAFALNQTDEKLFATHRRMKNMSQLNNDLDSMRNQQFDIIYNSFSSTPSIYDYNLSKFKVTPKEHPRVALAKSSSKDSLKILKNSPAYKNRSRLEVKLVPKPLNNETTSSKENKTGKEDTTAAKPSGQEEEPSRMAKTDINQKRRQPSYPDSTMVALDSAIKALDSTMVLGRAISKVNTIDNNISKKAEEYKQYNRQILKHKIEKGKKMSQAVACIIMFLIGAPLGAIIKRGGLGLPVLISIVYFIIFYVLTILGEKWVEEGLIKPFLGIWAANIILAPFAIIFLIQARLDTKLLDPDYYYVIFSNLIVKLGIFKNKFVKIKQATP